MNKNYAYYEDLYGNQYRWSTKKQNDGKFHINFFKLKKRTYAKLSSDYELVLIKERSFKQRKTAKAYCLKAYRKAKQKQSPIVKKRNEKMQERLALKSKHEAEVLERRKERLREAKEKRDSLKPKGREKAKIEAKAKKEHLLKLIKKTDTKIKSLTTRRKKYLKKLKYYDKRLLTMKDVYVSKDRNIPKYEDIED